MKIGIDISPLSSGHKVRGVGAYVSLLKNNIEKFDGENKYVFFEGKPPSGLDLVHYPYFDPFFPVLPFSKKTKTIVTVHDLTPIKFREHFPSGVKGNLRWQYNRFLLKKSDGIIVDSNASKKDVVKIIGFNEDRVKSVYLGSDPIYKKIRLSDGVRDEVKKRYSIGDNFMIYVGDVTWNKNLPRIVSAVKKVGIEFLLIGKSIADDNFDASNPWSKDRVELRRMIKGDEKIKVLGFVPDEDLSKIYNMAQGLLMPSLYEGFGLPVLEAMSCGCPVITSREGSLPEVGGDAVLYADALSVESIEEKIKELMTNKKLRDELSEKGLLQAKKFSIEKMIKDTLDVYKTFG